MGQSPLFPEVRYNGRLGRCRRQLLNHNPIDMSKRGWTKHTINVGDQVTVTVRPAKNGAPVGQLLKVVLSQRPNYDRGNPAVR